MREKINTINMVKIISWNINGVRSKSMDLFHKNNFNMESNLGKMMIEENPDIICFGETKCQDENIKQFKWPEKDNNLLYPFMAWNCSKEKKGYSGVGILSKQDFKNLGSIPTLEEDLEGRSLVLEFNDFYLIDVYTPNSGTKGEYRKIWDIKIADYLKSLQKSKKPIIYCGDLNVAAKEIDIHNKTVWKNEKNPGVYDYEKKGFNHILSCGYIDVWRHYNPTRTEKYTWWDVRSRSRNKNKGWRIDYFLMRENDIKYIKRVDILDHIFGSDHCPILLELNI